MHTHLFILQHNYMNDVFDWRIGHW